MGGQELRIGWGKSVARPLKPMDRPGTTPKIELPANIPQISVQVPTDNQLRATIDRFSRYVVANGHQFEVKIIFSFYLFVSKS